MFGPLPIYNLLDPIQGYQEHGSLKNIQRKLHRTPMLLRCWYTRDRLYCL